MTGQPHVRPYTLIYDGQCRVCACLVDRLASMDRRVAFETIPSQGEGLRRRFPWISPEALGRALQVVRNSDNRTWEGSMAVEEIVRQLSAGWMVSWLFSLPLGRRIASRLYKRFADHRHAPDCGERCRRQATSLDVDEKNA